MYSNAPSRAGLVALVFALIISLVSAVPIPISASQSGLSSGSNRYGQNLIHRDTAQIQLNGPISPLSATTRALTVNNIPMGADSQLVRRGLGAKIKAAFSKVGNAVKHVAEKIGSGIKTAAQKVASGVKTAATKVGSFMQHTAGKVIKFGLKVYASVTKVASKVVGFIPGIGKPIGKAMEGASEAENAISDRIHANLGRKLEKGMNVMNKADKIMGYIPRRRDLSEEDSDLQLRDIVYYLEERHDIPLELREHYVNWE